MNDGDIQWPMLLRIAHCLAGGLGSSLKEAWFRRFLTKGREGIRCAHPPQVLDVFETGGVASKRSEGLEQQSRDVPLSKYVVRKPFKGTKTSQEPSGRYAAITVAPQPTATSHTPAPPPNCVMTIPPAKLAATKESEPHSRMRP